MRDSVHRLILLCFVLAGLTCGAWASALANPGIPLPPARLSISASYHLGGYTLTNQEVPSLFNRIMARGHFSLSKYVGMGIDLGATQVEVASYTGPSGTVGVFHGKYGFSGGAHVKAASPYLVKNLLGLVAIGQATLFSSENANGALYGGFDAAGAAGVRLKLADVGSLCAGAHCYSIQGKNRSYLDKGRDARAKFSNVNNFRGWLAVDFLPALKGDVKGKPFFSFETMVAPKVKFGKTVPIREISFSFSVGWISPRLIGEDFEDTE